MYMEYLHIHMEYLQNLMVDIAEVLGTSASISTAFGCCVEKELRVGKVARVVGRDANGNLLPQ